MGCGRMAPWSTTPPPRPADALVRLTVDGAVATVTLDSPHNRNALSRQLVTELADRLERAEADAERPGGRAAPRPTGCSAPAPTCPRPPPTGMSDGTQAIVGAPALRSSAMSKPVVAVVAGPVRAGGIGLVAACDIVLSAEEATFALTEVKLGLAPAVISLTVLPRLTSRAAAYACLSGAVVHRRRGGADGPGDPRRPGRRPRRRRPPSCAPAGHRRPAGPARDQGAARPRPPRPDRRPRPRRWPRCPPACSAPTRRARR